MLMHYINNVYGILGPSARMKVSFTLAFILYNFRAAVGAQR